jgi:hypothetical protein
MPVEVFADEGDASHSPSSGQARAPSTGLVAFRNRSVSPPKVPSLRDSCFLDFDTRL